MATQKDHIIACLIEQAEASIYNLQGVFDSNITDGIPFDGEWFLEQFGHIREELNNISTKLRESKEEDPKEEKPKEEPKVDNKVINQDFEDPAWRLAHGFYDADELHPSEKHDGEEFLCICEDLKTGDMFYECRVWSEAGGFFFDDREQEKGPAPARYFKSLDQLYI